MRLLVSLLLIVFASFVLFISDALSVTDNPVRSGVVIFSVHPAYKVELPADGSDRYGLSQIDDYMRSIGATKVEPTFVSCLPPISGGPDLSLIHNLYFPESISVTVVIREFSKIEGIDIVEPWPIFNLCYNPNDPQFNSQYNLRLIQAANAWDVSRGDRRAVVASVDTGVDYLHPDLQANIWINPGEDLNGNGVIDNDENNGRDDDNNGYVNDFYGWDFVGNDNTPMDVDGHGTHTAGIMSAVTDNNVGIASIGFSCAIMAIRAGSGMQIQYGYQGIQYAVRNGAGVVNCSWGGYGDYAFARQVIEDASRRGVLVIAASGNDNNNSLHYPSCYPSVIAVSATNSEDRKADFSNYGDWVDICAPGVDILSTLHSRRYANFSGTSMASPLVAGVAVLLRAAYPNLSIAEIRQLILEGADNIYDRFPNNNYIGQLGVGRVNAYRSLLLGNRPILTIDTLLVVEDDDGNFRMDPGETVAIAVTLSNSVNGEATDGVRVFVYTNDPAIEFPPEAAQFPDLEPGQQHTNRDAPFYLRISDEAIPHTTWITIAISAEPGNIRMEKTFEVIIGHPDILIVDDDEGMSIEQIYFESIESMNQGWVRWDVFNNYSPDAATLRDYKMVLWVTGDANPPLDDLDRYQIQSALEDGANIVLIGKRIGDDPDNRDFLRTYFGAQHDQDSVQAVIATGLSGNRPISENAQLIMAGGGGSDPRISPSSMIPVRGADSLLVYQRAGGIITGLAGVWRTDPRTAARTIYLGFSFESVSNIQNSRNDFIRQLYEWYMSDPTTVPLEKPLPTSLYLAPIFPNPFNGLSTISYNLRSSGNVQLSVYDQSGRMVESLFSGIQLAGNKSIIWNASGHSSGIYFVRLDVAGYSPIQQRIVLVK